MTDIRIEWLSASTAWDKSPAEWAPDLRFIVAIMGLVTAGFIASCPLFDED